MEHVRVLRPADGIVAFYEGREQGHRFAAEPNWVDEGAISLGIASYAIVDDGEALIYDTHVSVDRARFIRETLEAEGVERFTVLLSHWHLDHIAGTEAFSDCEVIACSRTAEHLTEHRDAIEAGTYGGPPPIDPLILPTRTFTDRLGLTVGGQTVEAIHLNVHSDDAAVLWLVDRRILLAGDTLEDTVTYVDEPEAFGAHLTGLIRLLDLAPERILPNHGSPERIASGGYGTGLIEATQAYVRKLQRCVHEPELRDQGLREFVADSLSADGIEYFEPYEEVHRSNVAAVLAAAG